ncbi:MAG: hypothetical protein K2Q22_08280 [Cytophagales bacterium]|nr:hypothetical protein [Cytophagales bacterium]
MGNKIACLDCRKSFSQGTNNMFRKDSICPKCGKQMVLLSHTFRPPKRNEIKKWETISYLVQHGFYFQHVSDHEKQKLVEYPENMKDAIEFVKIYKDQSIKGYT